MPLRVELRARAGEVLGVTGESYDSLDSILPELGAESFPLASGIDRFGRTMFNRQQVNRLADEFERLLPEAQKRRERLLRELIELCSVASRTSEAELWFDGD